MTANFFFIGTIAIDGRGAMQCLTGGVRYAYNEVCMLFFDDILFCKEIFKFSLFHTGDIGWMFYDFYAITDNSWEFVIVHA